jgi:hypothetical protein
LTQSYELFILYVNLVKMSIYVRSTTTSSRNVRRAYEH